MRAWRPQGLAEAATKAEPDRSVTVALWSSDSSLFTPTPPPPPPPPAASARRSPPPAPVQPVPIIAANNDTSGGLRAERIFLWVMSAWIVIAFLALVGMALFAKPSTSATAAAGGVLDPSSQGAVVATAAQEATGGRRSARDAAGRVPQDTDRAREREGWPVAAQEGEHRRGIQQGRRAQGRG